MADPKPATDDEPTTPIAPLPDPGPPEPDPEDQAEIIEDEGEPPGANFA